MSRRGTTATPPCPYKGLDAFEAEDAQRFFGREHEVELIATNLRAARLTVLFGASGVGKTSVLKAGVVPRLEELARENLDELDSPELAVAVFSDWQKDPSAGLLEAVEGAVRKSLGEDDGDPAGDAAPPPGSWIAGLRRAADRVGGEVLVILDQFEDHLLHGGGSFSEELPRAINVPRLRANFLISIREDALAQLDRFKGSIPHLFDNSFPLDHLDRESARRAILGPLEEHNREHGSKVDIEPGLVEEVLDQAVTRRASAGGIETTYLQLVMTRLWEVELGSGSTVLRERTLGRLGGVDKIVRTHLDTALRELSWTERRAAVKIFDHLVTPTGGKQPQQLANLAAWAKWPVPRMRGLLQKLGKVRVLRPLGAPPGEPERAAYEIFHDVLGDPIAAWRRAVLARSRLLKQLAASGTVLLLLAVALLVRYTQARREVEALRRSSILVMTSAVEDPLVQALLVAELDPAGEPPNGLRIAGRVASTARPRAAFDVPAEEVRTVAFDPAGKRVVAGFSGGAARVWNAGGTGQPLELGGQRGTVYSAAFSPGGDRIVTGAADGSVYLWNADGSGEPARIYVRDASVLSVAFHPGGDHPGGDRVVFGANDGAVRIWNVGGPDAEAAVFAEPGGWVWSVALSPGGNRVAAGTDRGIARIWSLDGASPPQDCDHGGERVRSVAFDPDGRRLATGAGGLARIWAGDCSKVLEVLRHEGEVLSVAFAPGGERLVTASSDRKARIWHLDEAREPQVFLHGAGVASVAFDPEGGRIVTGAADGSVRIWDAGGPGFPEVYEVPGGEVLGLAFAAGGERLATLSSGGRVRISPAADPYDVLEEYGIDGDLDPDGAALGPDGRNLFAATEDGRVRRVAAGDAEPVDLGDGEAISASAFSPDGRRVATGSEDGRMRIWAADGSSVEELRDRHDKWVSSVAWSPGGERVVSSSDDGTVRIWHRGRSSVLASTAAGAEVLTAAFDPGGDRIVTGSLDGRAQVGRLGEDRTSLISLETLGQYDSAVVSVAFSPGGERVAAGAVDGAVRLWPTDRRESAVELTGHESPVRALAFSPDGQKLVTGSEDGALRIWQVGWAGLLDYLRGATTACLTIDQRLEYLVESYAEALAAHQECERRHGRTPRP